MENSNQNQSKSKLQKRKVFRIPLKIFATLGIRAKLAKQAEWENSPLNGKIFMGFLICGCALSWTFVFMLYDAKTFLEYAQTIYTCTFGTLMTVSLLVIVLKVEKLFEIINGFDTLVNTSKLNGKCSLCQSAQCL